MRAGQSILLVDNQQSVIDTVRGVAQEADLRLILAEDGQEGLDVAREEAPDLIIIRRNSPVLDALSLSVLLKQSEKTEKIPVVVICSNASLPERERLNDAGCSDFLVEPFTREELFNRIKEWLP